MSKEVECPYCEEWLEINHDDGFGYEEDKAHEMQCKECRKNFVFQTHVTYVYFASKADCLNGRPHNWSEWRRLWVDERTNLECQQRRCEDCDLTERRHVPGEKKPDACVPAPALIVPTAEPQQEEAGPWSQHS